jgi:hypothetical protein
MKTIEIKFNINDESYKNGDIYDLGPIARYFGYKPLDVHFIGHSYSGRVFKLPDGRCIVNVTRPQVDYNSETGEGVMRILEASKNMKNIKTKYVEADTKEYTEFYKNHNY